MLMQTQQGCHLNWSSEHFSNRTTMCGSPLICSCPDPKCPGQQMRIMLCYSHHLDPCSCLKPPASEHRPSRTGHGPPISLCGSKGTLGAVALNSQPPAMQHTRNKEHINHRDQCIGATHTPTVRDALAEALR